MRNLRICCVALIVAVGLGIFGVGSAAAQPGSDTLVGRSTLGNAPVSDQGGVPPGDQGGVQGESDNGDAPSGADVPDAAKNSPGSGASLPSTETSTPAASKAAASGSSGATLPFTGFLAIPALLAGMALLGAGLVVRQRNTA